MKKRLLKIVFFGSSHHSLSVLNTLFKEPSYKIVGIVSQPDRPVGRKKALIPTPPSVFAQERKIPLFRPDSDPHKKWRYEQKAEDELYRKLKTLKAGLLIVAYYGQKIPEKIVQLAKFGALNLHPSLLPKYRGSSPGQWAILAGEKETGLTILTVAPEFDQGQIVAQQKIEIKNDDNCETLYARCFAIGAKLLIQVLPDYLTGKVKPKPQPFLPSSPSPHSARRLTKADGKIDWSKPPDFIERQIRAFYPWPGAWTTLGELAKSARAPERKVKILKAHLDDQGKLVIDEAQFEGKNPVDWKTFEDSYLN